MQRITPKLFRRLRRLLGEVAERDVAWQESVREPTTTDAFAYDIIFVICNSGMTNSTATKIFHRIVRVLNRGRSSRTVFKHEGKCKAIDRIWRDRYQLFAMYWGAPDKLAFIAELPFIGPITKYHVAKNFGLPYAKPDLHIQRLADLEGSCPHEMCERLGKRLGLKASTVDIVLWRACATGLMNSRTGEINGRRMREAFSVDPRTTHAGSAL